MTAYKLNTLYAMICPSIHLSITRLDQSKTVKVMIMKFSPYFKFPADHINDQRSSQQYISTMVGVTGFMTRLTACHQEN